MDPSRQRINEIDLQILALIAERFNIVEQIVEKKHAAGLPIYDPEREAELHQLHESAAQELKLPPDLVREIFEALFEVTRGKKKVLFKSP